MMGGACGGRQYRERTEPLMEEPRSCSACWREGESAEDGSPAAVKPQAKRCLSCQLSSTRGMLKGRSRLRFSCLKAKRRQSELLLPNSCIVCALIVYRLIFLLKKSSI